MNRELLEICIVKSARQPFKWIAVIAALGLPLIAEAHPGHAGVALLDGFLHPWLGWDHLLAMLAVGLWARQQASGTALRPLARLPALFVAAVAFGALAGRQLGGGGLVEALIASSLIGLGALLAVSRTLPFAIAAAITLPMGLVHGWAHGAEMAADAPMLPFFAGFMLATAALHLCGIGLAALALNRGGGLLIRASGLGFAALGCGLLVGG
ncbi:MAG TPA: HupE/UreJ family protein [Fontimonas sp.]